MYSTAPGPGRADCRHIGQSSWTHEGRSARGMFCSAGNSGMSSCAVCNAPIARRNSSVQLRRCNGGKIGDDRSGSSSSLPMEMHASESSGSSTSLTLRIFAEMSASGKARGKDVYIKAVSSSAAGPNSCLISSEGTRLGEYPSCGVANGESSSDLRASRSASSIK